MTHHRHSACVRAAHVAHQRACAAGRPSVLLGRLSSVAGATLGVCVRYASRTHTHHTHTHARARVPSECGHARAHRHALCALGVVDTATLSTYATLPAAAPTLRVRAPLVDAHIDFAQRELGVRRHDVARADRHAKRQQAACTRDRSLTRTPHRQHTAHCTSHVAHHTRIPALTVALAPTRTRSHSIDELHARAHTHRTS
jgi:hypothetical protein